MGETFTQCGDRMAIHSTVWHIVCLSFARPGDLSFYLLQS